MNVSVLSFNTGYVSPKAAKRSDVEKTLSGCRVMENMIPLVTGPAERRSGTMYINTALGKCKVAPFIYSNSIAYQVEFSNLKARFFYDGALIAGADITTPYTEADLPTLQFKQSNDVMWITHNNYAPRKLTRTSATTFALTTITFTKGPFMKRHDLDLVNGNDDITMTPSVNTGTGILTASAAFFQSGHIGALFKLTQPRVVTEVTLSTAIAASSSSIPIKGAFSFDTSGTWAGTIRIERQEDGTNWETYRTYVNSGSNIQAAFTEEEDSIKFRITTVSMTSGTVSAVLRVNDSTESGICRIDSLNAATPTLVANITVLTDFAYDSVDGAKGTTKRWYEGAWSAVRGYPKTFTFFGGKAIYAGTTFEPQTKWESKVDDYENFEEGTKDADSFSLTLDSEDRNGIQWISSLNTILMGTSGSEWICRSTAYDQAITPTNFTVRKQTVRGCKDMQAIQAGDAVLFVDSVGRKVREISYRVDSDKYTSPNLTALSEDITLSGIVDWAYQKNPDPIVWCVLADGSLISMVYEREQNVIAWSKHPIGGNGFVESVCVTPADTEDVVTLSVKRTINGSVVRYIEQMQPRYWGTDQKYCFFVDSGLVYSGVAATVISGLDHLEGQTVAINGNGAEFPTKVVHSGFITLEEEVTYAIVGLPFTYKLAPLVFDTPSREGSTQGSIKTFKEVTVNFYQTLGATYGVKETDLKEIEWRTTEPYSSPPALFTGDRELTVDGEFEIDGTVYIEGNGIYPCCVRSIIAKIQKTGR